MTTITEEVLEKLCDIVQCYATNNGVTAQIIEGEIGKRYIWLKWDAGIIPPSQMVTQIRFTTHAKRIDCLAGKMTLYF